MPERDDVAIACFYVIFENIPLGHGTMTNEKGETFLVGKDVAKALGYSKLLNAIATHIEVDDSLKWGLVSP